MKVRFNNRDLQTFAVLAAEAVFRHERIGVIDSSGPPKGLLSDAVDPAPDFSTISRQRRRHEERKKAKQNA
jgi:hypothetical protein